eukprot:6305157-Pyramimonas_sp.AAC.1
MQYDAPHGIAPSMALQQKNAQNAQRTNNKHAAWPTGWHNTARTRNHRSITVSLYPQPVRMASTQMNDDRARHDRLFEAYPSLYPSPARSHGGASTR